MCKFQGSLSPELQLRCTSNLVCKYMRTCYRQKLQSRVDDVITWFYMNFSIFGPVFCISRTEHRIFEILSPKCLLGYRHMPQFTKKVWRHDDVIKNVIFWNTYKGISDRNETWWVDREWYLHPKCEVTSRWRHRLICYWFLNISVPRGYVVVQGCICMCVSHTHCIPWSNLCVNSITVIT